ncbi:MAG: FAD-dependent oxidoreductase [Clostridia bacterium]|nr:FAD-dependent oxidoreductase [Clostridia bacterium]
MKTHQAVIIGGGPAGLAAALRLKEKGISDILILEREHFLGGILRQCIHDGFGLTRFGESLSGPEYAQRFIDRINDEGIQYLTDCTVLDISPEKIVTAASKVHGFLQIQAEAVLLTMGCRERTRGALATPGTWPAGIYTAGVAQNYINLQNIMVGRKVVILGSGDIGLIMARRLTLEGAHVLGVYEVQPYPSGLPRNIEQCLNDYHIPLHLSHTVVDVRGRGRLSSVVVAECDERFRPIPGTETEIPCDTLILSVGLIPENELSLAASVPLDPRTRGAFVDEHCQTQVSGIFAAGNVLHVHDLVDFVSLEAEALADSAAEYLTAGSLPVCPLEVVAGANVGHVIPQRISGTRTFTLSLRVRRPLNNVTLVIRQGTREIIRRKMRKALPAEMIQIKIPAEKLQSDASLEVAVE